MTDDVKIAINVKSISFCGLLTILFIALKLTNYITWSWLWVLSPLWIPFAIGFAIGLVAIVVMLILGIIAAILGGKK